MTHRVAVTGIGLITPLGVGTAQTWSALLDGTVATKALTRFDASEQPSKIAAQADAFDPAVFLSRRRQQWTDRFSQLAVCAALLAAEDARADLRGSTAGVFTGSALGGVAFAEEQMGVFRERGLGSVRPLLTISVFGGAAASNIAIEFAMRGPTLSNADSCAAGAMAIGLAYRAIRRGEIRAAIAGGVEAPLAPLTFGAFNVARAMSARDSRPFDRARDGFVMAEGAGMLVLERFDDAQRRGAAIYGEIAGFASTNDAHHMSAPLPGGDQTAAAMQGALDDAGCTASEVEAINAHGSSTRLGDAAEAAAYARVFGERTPRIPVTATKGQHGHALGATGAWETAFTLLTMRDGILPGAVHYDEADPACLVDCRREHRELRPEIALSNSSGFGGINAALLLRRWSG